MAEFFETLFGRGERLVASAKSMIGASAGPDTPSSEVVCMRPKWALIADVMEGHDAIKAGRERYLPRYENETNKNFNRRLCDAPFRPIFASAVEALTARPFASP